MITATMKQAAQKAAAQLLVDETPKYKFVDRNPEAIRELQNRIESRAKYNGRITYSEWAKGVDIVMADGTVRPAQFLKGSGIEEALFEFLRYIALQSCKEHGFLFTCYVVNKGGSSPGKPSKAFFELAQELGLLASQDEESQDEFLSAQRTMIFQHLATKRAMNAPSTNRP